MTSQLPAKNYLKLLRLLTISVSLLAFQNINSQSLNVDLSTYVRVGRYDLPEPTRTPAPPNSLLAQEASGVTFNWDTQTLFVVGDGGTSVVQVDTLGQLINSMTLAPGNSPQGTDFYDPEGITYIGNGQFVLVEERDRQAVLFTYVAGGILTRSVAQTVNLGTFVQNIGIEGISYDPLTNGFICVKETQPEGIFQTGIDFNAGTASNGSPTTVNSIDLFNPALANLLDFADVFALSNLPALQGQPNYSNLLVLSQESGKIVNIDRSGNISSSLTIMSDPNNPLSLAAQQHEGLTMDRNGTLYTVSENGGGDFDHPQLWVYKPSTVPNQPPTGITLNNAIDSILENTSTASTIKVADIAVADDGLGNNIFTLGGTDASFFDIVGTQLFIKAGTVLDYETKSSYNITVSVDDITVGGTPDATINYTLIVADVVIETPPAASLIISEVAPWSSGNSPLGADWFEVTNTGTSAINITGWKMDDNSASFGNAAPLTGITSIGAGESVIFIESSSPSTIVSTFNSLWFGTNVLSGLQIGTYAGSGVGLSTSGDAVNLYDGTGALQASVSFGTSPAGPFPTFNNAAGLNNATISQLSIVGVNGAFTASNDAAEIGSPGTIGKVFISEVAPWSSGNSPVGADWFEVTNTKATSVDITGWKIDDNSGSPAAAVPLSGITSIAPGESVIFIESANPATTNPVFINTWFGSTPPAGLRIGNYTGSGVGLSTGGDAVNLYNSADLLQGSVSFGTSPAGPFPTFDNAAGLNNTAISQLSAAGVNGAFVAKNDPNEIGSPGTITTVILNTPPTVSITSPANGAAFNAGATVTILAQSADADGSVAKVVFFNNGVQIGMDATAPYSLSAQVEGGANVLTAIAIDNNGDSTTSNTVTLNVSSCNGSGYISASGYLNIPGSQVSNLTSSPKYPNNPDIVATLNTFEYRNVADNYGGRVLGYICAPVTGFYTFYIAGDDQAGLWLSTDENPANKVLIAYNESYVNFRSWYTNPTQQSAPVKLIKGARYYIETLHKEAVGPDHLSVAWMLPGNTFEGPIPGGRLSPYGSYFPGIAGGRGFAEEMANANSKSAFKVVATPNPASSYFTLHTSSISEERISIIVTDAIGRVMERRNNEAANGTIQFGNKLPKGIYIAEVSQGANKQILKLVKQ